MNDWYVMDWMQPLLKEEVVLAGPFSRAEAILFLAKYSGSWIEQK